MIITWLFILICIVAYAPHWWTTSKTRAQIQFVLFYNRQSFPHISFSSSPCHPLSFPQAITGWWLPDNLAKIYSDSSLVAHSRTHVTPSFVFNASIWFDLRCDLSVRVCLIMAPQEGARTHVCAHAHHNMVKENWMNGELRQTYQMCTRLECKSMDAAITR